MKTVTHMNFILICWYLFWSHCMFLFSLWSVTYNWAHERRCFYGTTTCKQQTCPVIVVFRCVFLFTFPFYYFLSRFEVKTTQSAFKFNVCTKPAQPVSQNTLSQFLTIVVLKYFDNFANWILKETFKHSIPCRNFFWHWIV